MEFLLQPPDYSFNNVDEDYLFAKDYPITHIPRRQLIPQIPDSILSVIAPVVAYWAASAWFSLLDYLELPFFEKYRIHDSEETKKKNRVTKVQVVKAVLVQQFFQTILGLVFISEDEISPRDRDYRVDIKVLEYWVYNFAQAVLGDDLSLSFWKNYGPATTVWIYWWGFPIVQFLWAFFVMDTWQYFLHRLFHTSTFLYRNIHSWHHRLYAPYSFGALYNHPLEGFLFDSMGGIISHFASGMSTRQAVLLFTLSTLKTVDDHCGYSLPFDPLQLCSPNNADYHDIHHQIWGIKKNFSQPWFIHWDYFLGTRMTRKEAPAHSKKFDSEVTKENQVEFSETSSESSKAESDILSIKKKSLSS